MILYIHNYSYYSYIEHYSFTDASVVKNWCLLLKKLHTILTKGLLNALVITKPNIWVHV